MHVFVDHHFDDLVEHRRLHLRVHFGGIDFSEHAPDIEIVFLFWVLDRRVDHRPGMLDGLIAVGRRGENIERVAEHRPAELVRFIHRRFRHLRLQPLEELDAVDAFLDQITNRFSRFVFAVDDDAGALAPEACRCPPAAGHR